MVLTLRRLTGGDQGTPGLVLRDGELVCRTMELPWRDNRPNVSRIPPGRYVCRYLARSASGHYHDVYHVTGIPHRAGILIHRGNWAGDRERGLRTDSWGCLLACSRFGRLLGQLAGLVSAGGLARLHAATGRRDFFLEVLP